MQWQPVLCLSVRRTPFTALPEGLVVTRMHLAAAPSGIVARPWLSDDPPRAVGWDPKRDVPFVLPVKFVRQGEARASLLPSGTWILPYDDDQYQLYRQLQMAWRVVLTRVNAAPHHPYTTGLIRSLLNSFTASPNLN